MEKMETKFLNASSMVSTERALLQASIISAAAETGPLAEDPLFLSIAYCRWALHKYKMNEKEMGQVLFEICREHKTSKKYLNDPRYVCFWLLYAVSGGDFYSEILCTCSRLRVGQIFLSAVQVPSVYKWAEDGCRYIFLHLRKVCRTGQTIPKKRFFCQIFLEWRLITRSLL